MYAPPPVPPPSLLQLSLVAEAAGSVPTWPHASVGTPKRGGSSSGGSAATSAAPPPWDAASLPAWCAPAEAPPPFARGALIADSHGVRWVAAHLHAQVRRIADGGWEERGLRDGID